MCESKYLFKSVRTLNSTDRGGGEMLAGRRTFRVKEISTNTQSGRHKSAAWKDTPGRWSEEVRLHQRACSGHVRDGGRRVCASRCRFSYFPCKQPRWEVIWEQGCEVECEKRDTRACIVFDFDTQRRRGEETREEVKLFIFWCLCASARRKRRWWEVMQEGERGWSCFGICIKEDTDGDKKLKCTNFGWSLQLCSNQVL